MSIDPQDRPTRATSWRASHPFEIGVVPGKGAAIQYRLANLPAGSAPGSDGAWTTVFTFKPLSGHDALVSRLRLFPTFFDDALSIDLPPALRFHWDDDYPVQLRLLVGGNRNNDDDLGEGDVIEALERAFSDRGVFEMGTISRDGIALLDLEVPHDKKLQVQARLAGQTVPAAISDGWYLTSVAEAVQRRSSQANPADNDGGGHERPQLTPGAMRNPQRTPMVEPVFLFDPRTGYIAGPNVNGCLPVATCLQPAETNIWTFMTEIAGTEDHQFYNSSTGTISTITCMVSDWLDLSKRGANSFTMHFRYLAKSASRPKICLWGRTAMDEDWEDEGGAPDGADHHFLLPMEELIGAPGLVYVHDHIWGPATYIPADAYWERFIRMYNLGGCHQVKVGLWEEHDGHSGMTPGEIGAIVVSTLE